MKLVGSTLFFSLIYAALFALSLPHKNYQEIYYKPHKYIKFNGKKPESYQINIRFEDNYDAHTFVFGNGEYHIRVNVRGTTYFLESLNPNLIVSNYEAKIETDDNNILGQIDVNAHKILLEDKNRAEVEKEMREYIKYRLINDIKKVCQ